MEDVISGRVGFGDYCRGFLDTRFVIPAYSGRSGIGDRRTMRQPMTQFYEVLEQRFGTQIQRIFSEREEEIYILVGDPDVRALVDCLRNEFEASLVTAFAQDRPPPYCPFFN